MLTPRNAAFVLSLATSVACGGGDGPENQDASDTGGGGDATPLDLGDPDADFAGDDDVFGDAEREVSPPDADASDPDEADAAESRDSTDAPDDTGWPPPVSFETRGPQWRPAPDPLAGTGDESCAIFLSEQCGSDSRLRRCEVFDVSTASFVDDPDPVLRRVLLFDRWFDLYHSPSGQACERMFLSPMDASAPEATWSDEAEFARYVGVGDSAIWSGVALNGALMRYLSTGTPADLERVTLGVRDLLTLFDVTGMPGYLARHHFLEIEPGERTTSSIIAIPRPDERDHRDNPIPDPASIPNLPQEYMSGYVADSGETISGTPMWHGNPSIDQYTGPMVALPAAYPLLDEELQARIREQLTCYLKRLRRIEIRNVRSSGFAQDAVAALFARGTLDLDPDDIDLAEIDRVVVYYLPQFNRENADTYPRECPGRVATEPELVIDAAGSSFLTDLIALVGRINSRESEMEDGIDHFYAPGLRGGDAIHLMHLAALGWEWTGDAMYADFLRDELLGRARTAEVALTAGAFSAPKWCRSFYGNHITFPPAWAFTNLLDDSGLRDVMFRVLEEELWIRENRPLGNAKFAAMYLGVVPPEIATGRDEAMALLTESIETLGGNGGTLDAPRRGWWTPWEEVTPLFPSGTESVCPSDEDLAGCEGTSLLGMTIPPEVEPLHGCFGVPGECPIGDRCAWAMSNRPLPPALRSWSDNIWQRNPFEIGHYSIPEGVRQSPGLDVTEVYWLARYYGLTERGDRQVLAWHDVGTCE